ncbi:uncharacterized protein F5147DRAFT_779556 [Suillus discolor]|uniref:Uncharacterized protein n=1 Tax=Suillus discolor TaxID=1912936 RepID=A0A9P7JN63_9AGAM|nr:uncharacterized protein F5147DRAFT_779556 [Suillus discolor]KAG2092813.1 hypothetical protein F5147DRAFT_779556 [Suillus discolor]
MLSSSLKFDITTLRSLSALASSSDNPAHHSYTKRDNDSNVEIPASGSMCDLYGVLEAVNSLSSTHEPTDSEASLVLDLVRAKRDVFRAQKTLADCVLQENEVSARLLKFQAAAVEKKINETDIGLGCMRIIFKDCGWSHVAFSHPPQGQGWSSAQEPWFKPDFWSGSPQFSPWFSRQPEPDRKTVLGSRSSQTVQFWFDLPEPFQTPNPLSTSTSTTTTLLLAFLKLTVPPPPPPPLAATTTPLQQQPVSSPCAQHTPENAGVAKANADDTLVKEKGRRQGKEKGEEEWEKESCRGDEQGSAVAVEHIFSGGCDTTSLRRASCISPTVSHPAVSHPPPLTRDAQLTSNCLSGSDAAGSHYPLTSTIESVSSWISGYRGIESYVAMSLE